MTEEADITNILFDGQRATLEGYYLPFRQGLVTRCQIIDTKPPRILLEIQRDDRKRPSQKSGWWGELIRIGAELLGR